MVSIREKTYVGDFAGLRYVRMAQTLGMERKACRDMYEGLHPVAREELDVYLGRVVSMEICEVRRHIRASQNRPSKITVATGELAA